MKTATEILLSKVNSWRLVGVKRAFSAKVLDKKNVLTLLLSKFLHENLNSMLAVNDHVEHALDFMTQT